MTDNTLLSDFRSIETLSEWNCRKFPLYILIFSCYYINTI